MIFEVHLNEKNKIDACNSLLAAWKKQANKVFILRANQHIRDVKCFYEGLFPYLGKPQAFAEDATIGSRDQQRTDAIWMEVRYDPTIKNAYRHSSDAQPLHTDGSYIPNFPSTLMCCVANTDKGGETIFIDSEDVYQSLSVEEPVLLNHLMTEKIPHERSGDARSEYPLYQKNNQHYVNWNYYCVSNQLSAKQKSTVGKFQHFLLTSAAIKQHIQAVKLRPGDAVVWKDDQVLHGRNAFSANQTSERFIWKCAIAIQAN